MAPGPIALLRDCFIYLPMGSGKKWASFAAQTLQRDIAGVVVCSRQVLFLPMLACGLIMVSGTGFMSAFSHDIIEAYAFVHKHSIDEARAIIQTKYQRALYGLIMLALALLMRRLVLLVLIAMTALLFASQLNDYFITAQVEFSREGFVRLRQAYLMQLVGLSVLVRTMFLATLVWALAVMVRHHLAYHSKNTA